ncbi:hypothetical protein LCGC14_0929600 [marine sediment metagenome]|uniref:Uncharacterized protein n=1 Tax=marine sediment metagenome TaxID=412755 RepID=A0A0F9NSW3_9ZZZZ
MTIHAVVLEQSIGLLSSISDASTFYLGAAGAVPTGTAADHAIAGGPLARTVRAVRLFADVGAFGTAELVDAKILNITDGSSYTINSDGFDADGVFLNADVAAPLAVGDQWCVELSTLAWATNPSDLQVDGVVYIEDDAEETVLSAALVKIAATSQGLISDISGLVVTDAKLDLTSANASSDVSDIVVTDAKVATVSQALISDISGLVVTDAKLVLISDNLASDISDIVVTDAKVATVSDALVSDISALVVAAAEADAVSDAVVSMQAAAGVISDIVSDLVVTDAKVATVSDALVSDISALAALPDASAAISGIQSDIVSNAARVSGVIVNVTAAQSDADVNAASITALDLTAPEIVILNALLAENPPGILSAEEVAAIRSKVTTKLSGDAGTAR